MSAFRYFFIIYFYICGVNADGVKDMQTLLNDIELDIQELKCLIQAISIDANPTLKIVAKRNIQQMKARLDALQKLLDEPSVIASQPEKETPIVSDPHIETVPQLEPIVSNAAEFVCEQPVAIAAEQVQPVATSASPILAERIKPATDLRHAISLNDSFRFTRELFDGNATRMNEVVRRVGEASSLDEAMEVFISEVHPDEENEATIDFIELLKKYFS